MIERKINCISCGQLRQPYMAQAYKGKAYHFCKVCAEKIADPIQWLESPDRWSWNYARRLWPQEISNPEIPDNSKVEQ